MTGRVLFDNKPLPGGRITFRPADPKAETVYLEIEEDGTWFYCRVRDTDEAGGVLCSETTVSS